MGRGLNGNRMTLYSPMLALDLPPHLTYAPTIICFASDLCLPFRVAYMPQETYLLIGRALAAVSSRLNWTLLCDACLLAWPIVADID